MAIPETVTIFDVVTCLPAPVAHLAVVLAPCMNGSIAYSDLSPTASLAFEVGGCMHLAVDTMANASYSVSGSEAVRTPVYSQAFVLEGLLRSSDMVGNLAGFGMVSTEILDFTL